MNKIIAFLKKKWFVQSMGLAAVVALIWFAGPFIGIGRGNYPLASDFNRLLAISVAVIAWVIYNLVMRSRANQRDRQFMDRMATAQKDPEQEEIDQRQKEEAERLRLKLEDALRKLKDSKAKSRWDRQYLYDLPWYMIIGAPGCGKTTLIVNSGLRLLSSKYENVEDVKGVGGTRNCDWLFSDEAIFLDTAGRYATQDSHRSADEASWRRFLELLKTYRSRRPINGVLVTVSIADLLKKSESERRKHAKEIRHRVEELKEALGVRFPIYTLFSKCDLISGFNDFFADLNPEQREQVWGVTFPEPEDQRTNQYLADYEKDFDDLLARLDTWTLGRIQQTQDIQRRSLILDFPRQMASVKPTVTSFLREAFGTTQFDKPFLLRGVYFTSATQEGTPIDRIMGVLANAYGLDSREAPVYSGRGKSFFLSRLLKEVVFPEAELAGTDPKIERRRLLTSYMACGAVILTALLICAGWAVSYANNKRRIAEVQRIVASYPEAAQEAGDDWEKAVKKLHDRLGKLCAARRVYENPSAFAGFGLDQSGKIVSQIDDTYHEILEKELLPVVKKRLEQDIQLHLSRQKSDGLYNLLKVYLLLDRTPGERQDDLDLAMEIVGNIWDESDYLYHFGGKDFRNEYREQIRELFSSHFDEKSSELNLAIVERARNQLNDDPLYMRIYNQLIGKFLTDNSFDFKLKEALGRYGIRVFAMKDGRDLETVQISGLYTYEGYHEIFEKRGYAFVEEALRENWVTENPAAEEKDDLHSLYGALQDVYISDYSREWSNLRNNIAIKQPQNTAQLRDLLYFLTHSESPLPPLIEAICRHTSIARQADSSSDGSEETSENNLPDNLVSDTSEPPHEKLLAMDRDFERFCVMSTGGDPSQPSIEEVGRQLKQLQDILEKTGIASRGSDKGIQNGLEDVQRQLNALPPPMDAWFDPLIASTQQASLNETKKHLNGIWKSQVLKPFRETLAGRYPLEKGSQQDAKIADFRRFFAPGGIIDRFFDEQLQGHVDTTAVPWREIPTGGQKMGLTAEVLVQLQHAGKIRNSFFAVGSPGPSVSFDLKPIDMDPKAGEFFLNLEGQSIRYRHGPRRVTSFQWPGPQPDDGVRINFKDTQRRETGSPQNEEGDWAWFRILDRSGLTATGETGRFIVRFQSDDFWASYELTAHSAYNPFGLDELRQFRCPENL